MKTKEMKKAEREFANVVRKESAKAVEIEYRSLSALFKAIKKSANNEAFENWMFLHELTLEEVTTKSYFWPFLKLHTFTAKSGQTYESIYTKDKFGNITERPWTVTVLQRACEKAKEAENKRKGKILTAEEVEKIEAAKAAEIAKMKAKEESLKQLSEDEKVAA